MASTSTPRNKRNIDETVSPNSHVDAPRPTRRRNSIGSSSELLSNLDENPLIIANKGKQFDLSQLVRSTIANEAFADSIAPSLIKGLEPKLKEIINSVVECALTTALKSVSSLIENQTKIIEGLKSDLSTKNVILDNLKEKNTVLEAKVKDVECENQRLAEEVDSLEQYGRRNSLRFHGIPATNSNTDDTILKLINEQLLPDHPIDIVDIERSHFIGKPVQGKTQIICKFKSWRTKSAVYKAKTKLKNFRQNGQKIFISEDLTRDRQVQVKNLSEARKSRKIHSYWTNDGRIFYKRSVDSAPILVKSIFETIRL